MLRTLRLTGLLGTFYAGIPVILRAVYKLSFGVVFIIVVAVGALARNKTLSLKLKNLWNARFNNTKLTG